MPAARLSCKAVFMVAIGGVRMINSLADADAVLKDTTPATKMYRPR
jgi:hypothetical protein